MDIVTTSVIKDAMLRTGCKRVYQLPLHYSRLFHPHFLTPFTKRRSRDEDGGCDHFKWVYEEEEFRAFKKQLNLQHRDTESVTLLRLIVGLLVSILFEDFNFYDFYVKLPL
uniref:Uncharacterized protein n=1 Tax=Lactuca sativa TaxID=4236 RepID=A0A9R1W573_LACSA|nr:hypothetical protein LSAT_V11C300101920 [Lactuca sativa]